uniref:(northern house mosquito) hypothetical protein n=1 Tax=Culex pipiens TaxID=7175 RepID=A0A8D8MUY4_CULPI
MLICFLSCVFFSFPSCARDKYLHKAHIRLLARSLAHSHSCIFSLTRRDTWSPQLNVLPVEQKKYIYYTFFSGSFVCVYFLNINMLMIFPFIFQLLLLPVCLCVCVWFIYISRTIAYTYFLLFC